MYRHRPQVRFVRCHPPRGRTSTGFPPGQRADLPAPVPLPIPAPKVRGFWCPVWYAFGVLLVRLPGAAICPPAVTVWVRFRCGLAPAWPRFLGAGLVQVWYTCRRPLSPICQTLAILSRPSPGPRRPGPAAVRRCRTSSAGTGIITRGSGSRPACTSLSTTARARGRSPCRSSAPPARAPRSARPRAWGRLPAPTLTAPQDCRRHDPCRRRKHGSQEGHQTRRRGGRRPDQD
jgi:hypothetical protein